MVLTVTPQCHCRDCKAPLDFRFIGPMNEIDVLFKWRTVGRDIFQTNRSFISRGSRVCYDCFLGSRVYKKIAYKMCRARELTGARPGTIQKTVMGDYEADFWIRSMIHNFNSGFM